MYILTQFCLLHFNYCSKSFGKGQVLSPSSFPINSKQMKLLFFDQRNRALKGGNIWKKIMYHLLQTTVYHFPFHTRATQMFSFLLPFFFQLRSLTKNGNVGIAAVTSTVFASYTWNIHFSNPRLSCFLVQNSGRLSRAKERMPLSDRLPNRCSKRQLRLL